MSLKERSSEQANKAADLFLKMLKAGVLRRRPDPTISLDRHFDEAAVLDAMENKLHHDLLKRAMEEAYETKTD